MVASCQRSDISAPPALRFQARCAAGLSGFLIRHEGFAGLLYLPASSMTTRALGTGPCDVALSGQPPEVGARGGLRTPVFPRLVVTGRGRRTNGSQKDPVVSRDRRGG